MATDSPHSKKVYFLPNAFRAVLSRYIHQVYGLLFFLSGAYVFISLATYDPVDPSWNAALDSTVRNWGGKPGALFSDILLQLFGISSFLCSALLISWGRLKFFQRPIKWVTGKALLAIAAIVFLSLSSTLIQLPGGAVGELITRSLLNAAPVLSHPPYRILTACAGFALAFPFVVLSLGITFREAWSSIQSALRLLYKAFSHVLSFATWARAKRSQTKAIPERTPCVFAQDEVLPQEDVVTKVRSKTKRRSITSDLLSDSDIEVIETQKKHPKNTIDIETRSDYQLPPLSLLADAKRTGTALSKAELETQAAKLMDVLEEFGVKGEISEIRTGPVVTLYELIPAPGIKSSRVIGLADDIARSMSALSTRVAVIPGRNAIGIELPNEKRQTVFFKELLTDQAFEGNSGSLPLVLGKDIAGHAIIADLARMPHLLVAGTTGSGKSVGVNSMILSLIYRLPPDRCKFIMIDPKMLELSIYNDIPHLLTPVVTEPKKAIVALKWAVREMENRYRSMSKLGVRNITGYNERIYEARIKGEAITRRVQTGFDAETDAPYYENQPLDLEPLPYIVVVVDEMADLMLVAGKEIEAAVQRLAQMARAAGIHLIMATQRPSVDVITGTIKANFPTRISFQVTSKIDSRTILGEQGAEQLLGMGDLLFLSPGGRTTRVHGPFVSDLEVEKIVHFLKQQSQPHYIDSITQDIEAGFNDDNTDTDQQSKDELYDQAVTLIMRENKVSTSFIQRHFQIGYNRAARIVEQMEEEGIISEPNRTGRREVLAKHRTMS